MQSFCFFPSTTDQKEEIDQHISNVNLHDLDCPYDDFQKLSHSDTPFVLSDVEVSGEKRKAARDIVVNFLNKAVGISNANLIRNANYLLSAMEVEPNVEWVGKGKEDWTVPNTI